MARDIIVQFHTKKEDFKMATKVRYVNSSSGLNVRKTAAGTKVTTLNNGDLMYDISGVSNVTASLNGTSYVWVKVHYFKTGTTTEEGDGWVTVKNTTTISTTIPTKSKVLNSNSSLKQYEQLINARYIHNYLKGNNWSDNAIYAVLGNMEAESTINPGKWESADDTSKGYGLVQWTPATKYIDWLSSGEEKSDIDNQLARILYEVKNSLQWNSRKHSPTMSFSSFTTSTKACSILAEYFVRCYERPSSVDSKVAKRQSNATKWSTLIGYLL